MIELDDIAISNGRHWEKTVRDGAGCTRPHLTLDVEAFKAYREHKTKVLPAPHCDDPIDRVVMKDVQGKQVLCLAAGGGQQSAAYSLLGAHVTVFDLAEGQLEGDRMAAAHYGYDVTTIRGDMRDLAVLADQSFDIVHGMGMAWIPDTFHVYPEVTRTLKTGGLYRVSFTNPAVEFMDGSSWDGKGYRITVPYTQSREKEGDEIQFRHYMCDIFNGLVSRGFSIEQVEDRWIGQPDLDAPAGSWEHWLAYIVGFEIVARKSVFNARAEEEL